MTCTNLSRRWVHGLHSAILHGLVLAVLCVVSSPKIAGAQDKLEQARQHYDRGTAFFKQKLYDQALRELMQAYVLDPNPALVFNIARCHEEKNDVRNAVKYFTSFMAISRSRAHKRRVRKRLKRLKRILKRMPAVGFVSVQTTPPGATVRIDGRVIGQTPVQPVQLSPGQHALEIALAGYQAHRGQVVVISGQTTPVRVQMLEGSSAVTLTTQPAGAVAELLSPQRKSLGACPCVFKAGSGSYEIEVKMKGYQAKRIKFSKRVGENLRINVNLTNADTTGRLFVDALVPGAEIRIDGAAIASAPLAEALRVEPGRRTVEVIAPGFSPWRTVVQINTGMLTRVVAQMVRAMPTSVVDSVPVSLSQTTTGLTGWGWTLTSLGIAALLGGGVTTTLAALEKQRFNESDVFKLETGDLARLDMSREDAFASEKYFQQMYYTSLGLYSGGAALLITGITMIAVDGGPVAKGPGSTPEWAINPTRGGAMLNVSTAF